MNIADIAVLASVGLTFLVVIRAVIGGILGREIYGQFVIFPFLVLVLAVSFKDDQSLRTAFFFSLLAGAVLQPMIADPYLLKKTLSYGGRSWRIIQTPWWMALLWATVLTQLSYGWLRLDAVFSSLEWINSFENRYAVFVLFGSMYFWVFELVVNNLTGWWERKNCWQLVKVAVYASLAEILTVAILPIFSELALKLWPEAIVAVGLWGGVAIAFIFRGFCFIFYRPRKKERFLY